MSDMRETDTITEAVEAMACHLSLHWNGAAAEMLRTLLRERNEARRERDEAFEECAKIAANVAYGSPKTIAAAIRAATKARREG